MLICTLYNHKGGVSKTTTTFNLAYALAESKKKVIVVDADPQCNITDLMLAPVIDEADAEAERRHELTSLPGTTVLDALRPRFEGARATVDVESVELVAAPYDPRIQILRGDVGLSAAEDELSLAHIQRLSGQTHFKLTYVAVHDLLRRLGRRENADVILVDVGPSAGSLTRSFFLACDAFFVPLAPDRFSVQAIGSLSKIIPKWIKEHRQIVDDFRELQLPVSEGAPLFLGTIVQNYKLARGSRPRPGFELWMERIPVRVKDTLIPSLAKLKGLPHDLLSVAGRKDIEAARIPDFGSLATCMQDCARPIFALRKEDTASISSDGKAFSGIVWDDALARMKEWRKHFKQLEKRLEGALEFVDG